MMIFHISKNIHVFPSEVQKKKLNQNPDLDSKEEKTFSIQTCTHSIALKIKMCKGIHLIFSKERIYKS